MLLAERAVPLMSLLGLVRLLVALHLRPIHVARLALIQKIEQLSESILFRLFDLLRTRHRSNPLLLQLMEDGVDEFLVDQRECCAELFLSA